jgi:hypothetical protein
LRRRRKAGIIVTTRRTQTGMRLRMKPCITTCPASVPTADDDRPDPSSAIANSAPAAPPRIGSSVLWAPSSESTFGSPLRQNVLAAITSIDMLIRPGDRHRDRSRRSRVAQQPRAAPSSSATIRSCVSAEWR